MKIIIAGAGKVGDSLARQLASEDCDLTLIDSKSSVLAASVERYDVMTVQGNCAARDVLLQAGVEEADLLIAVTDADEVNLLACLTAHGINPKLHTIARVRNPEYYEQIYAMRDVFALSMAVNPELQTALEIEHLLKFPGFLKRESFAKGRMELVELRVDEGSKLCDLPLSNLNSVVGCRVLVCTVVRENKACIPDGNYVLQEGDQVYVTAPAENLVLLLKNLGIITRKVSNVMLVGGGRIGIYLANLLDRSGISVTLMEKDPELCEQLSELLPHACVICGDGSSQSVLESEGLANCDALVTLTGHDELNMIISLYGSSLGVRQTITKLGRTENAKVLSRLPLGSLVCPRELCSANIVRYVRAMRNQTGAALTVHSIAEGQAEAAEFLVDETTAHCGEKLRDLKLRKGVLIAGISHGTRTEIPNGDSSFRQGDTVLIVTSGDRVVYQLNDIFE